MAGEPVELHDGRGLAEWGITTVAEMMLLDLALQPSLTSMQM
jgi:hypothetical protein